MATKQSTRIQICCAAAVSELEVHLLHIYPEYRLQLGDFRDALEAERTLNLIRVHYPGAFTLATEIQWPAID